MPPNAYDTRTRLDRWAPNRARPYTERWWLAIALITAGLLQVVTGILVLTLH